MKRAHLKFGEGFHVVVGNARSQAAQMVMARGTTEGGPENRHRGADQWLFVISGSGVAIVNRKRHSLRAGSLVLIERGDAHEIRNTGRTKFKTLSVYVPPAYAADGNELAAGKP